MPRSSLPTQLKSLKSYEVILTQTEEDELLAHFITRMAWFNSASEKYIKYVTDAVNMFSDENPYAKKDWKKGNPKRYYNETHAWLENDDEITEYLKIGELAHDLTIIAKTFEWEDVNDWVFKLDKFRSIINSEQATLLQNENVRFYQAKKVFEDENMDWIKRKDQMASHTRNHPTAYTLFQNFEANNNLILDCIYCISSLEKEKATINDFRLREHTTNHFSDTQMSQRIADGKCVESFATTCKLCLAQYNRLKMEIQTIEHTEIAKVMQICEDCTYKSKNEVDFNLHFQNTYHLAAIKRKELYCEVCEVQCQCTTKYEEHLDSAKHKKNSCEVKVPKYTCTECNYTTELNHHYTQHINSKKHKENSIK